MRADFMDKQVIFLLQTIMLYNTGKMYDEHLPLYEALVISVY